MDSLGFVQRTFISQGALVNVGICLTAQNFISWVSFLGLLNSGVSSSCSDNASRIHPVPPNPNVVILHFHSPPKGRLEFLIAVAVAVAVAVASSAEAVFKVYRNTLSHFSWFTVMVWTTVR